MNDNAHNTGRLQIFTASSAARELGVSITQVRRWLADGLLREVETAEGTSPFRFVDADSVFALKRSRAYNRPKPGRPRKQPLAPPHSANPNGR